MIKKNIPNLLTLATFHISSGFKAVNQMDVIKKDVIP